MKLLTTCIFLIVSLVMMNSSFAQDDADLIAAIKEQTAAIKEQTITMKVIALNNSGFNLGGAWERIRNDYLAIEKIIERQARFDEADNR